MKISYKIGLTTIAFFVILFISSSVYASTISLNGNYDDWIDKPFVQDKPQDEIPSKDIILFKWYPDLKDQNLYFYCERLGNNESIDEDINEDDSIDIDINTFNKKYDDDEVKLGKYKHKYWRLELFINSELGEQKAVISYRPANRKVLITLYDKEGRFLWSGNGKWGDNKTSGKNIEFYIPFSYLVSSTKSGYQVDLYCLSGSDKAPDNGNIIISTISTFPIHATIALILFLICVFFKLNYKRLLC